MNEFTYDNYLHFAKEMAFLAGKIMRKYFLNNSGANYKFDQTPIALIYSTTKIKVIKSITEYRNLLFSFINTSIKIFVIPIIIFYLLCYIGLLRLFGSISLLLSLINSVRNSVYLHT